jgi:hypothetical protein
MFVPVSQARLSTYTDSRNNRSLQEAGRGYASKTNKLKCGKARAVRPERADKPTEGRRADKRSPKRA